LAGTFQRIRIVNFGFGVQIVANTDVMSDTQVFIFCILGAVATLIVGYIMVWQRKSILKSSSLLFRAIAYYATLIFLCLDPLYLSVMHYFLGGGDFNGIVLVGIPEIAAVIFFLILLTLNLFVFIRLIYPSYKQRFLEN
jgi:hypothetical protein